MTGLRCLPSARPELNVSRLAMRGYWYFHTRWGTFVIVPITTGWQVRFEEEALGNYTFAQAALDNLLSGHCARPTNGIDPLSAGLPQRLTEWTFVRR